MTDLKKYLKRYFNEEDIKYITHLLEQFDIHLKYSNPTYKQLLEQMCN